MEHLFELLVELSIDPFKHAAFVADRQQEGLSAEDYGAIAQARSSLAQAAIAGEGWSRCAIFADPGPDPEDDPDVPEIRRRKPCAERLGQRRTIRVSCGDTLGTGGDAHA